jgi:hypothetical protein
VEEEYAWPANVSANTNYTLGEERHRKELEQSTRFDLFTAARTDQL